MIKKYVNTNINVRTRKYIGLFTSLKVLKQQNANLCDYALYERRAKSKRLGKIKKYDKYTYDGLRWICDYRDIKTTFKED